MKETHVYSVVATMSDQGSVMLAVCQLSVCLILPVSGSGKGSKPAHGRKGSQSGGNSSQGQSKVGGRKGREKGGGEGSEEGGKEVGRRARRNSCTK